MEVNACNGVGFAPHHLRSVFPYHVAFDDEFRVIQLGENFEKIFHLEKCISTYIGNHFSVTSPKNLPWDWKKLNMCKDMSFGLKLTSNSSNLKNSGYNLSLKGKLLLMRPGTPQTSSGTLKLIGVFLLDLDITSMDELKSAGLTLQDISSFGCRKELILMGENLKSEMASTNNLQIASKILRIQALEENTNKMQNVLEMKRAFIKYISHEIHTPLNIITMGLKLLQSARNSNAWSAAATSLMISDMRTTCSAAMGILNDLLLYEKIESNSLSFKIQEVNVYDVVKEAVQPFNISAITKGITLITDLEKSGVIAKLDPTKYSQVLRSVMSNAIKYTPVGGLIQVSAEIIGAFPSNFNESPTKRTMDSSNMPNEFLSPLAFHAQSTHTEGSKRKRVRFSDLNDEQYTEKLDENIKNSNYSVSLVDSLEQLSTLNPSITSYTTPVPAVTAQISQLHKMTNITPPPSVVNPPGSQCLKLGYSLGLGQESSSHEITSVNIHIQSYSCNSQQSIEQNELTTEQSISTQPAHNPHSETIKTGVSRPLREPATAQPDEEEQNACGLQNPESSRSFGLALRIKVVDNGPGIPLEDQLHLFSQCRQIQDVNRRKMSSPGMGLWLAHSMIQAQGGRIGVESAGLGRGSTFYVDIPLIRLQSKP